MSKYMYCHQEVQHARCKRNCQPWAIIYKVLQSVIASLLMSIKHETVNLYMFLKPYGYNMMNTFFTKQKRFTQRKILIVAVASGSFYFCDCVCLVSSAYLSPQWIGSHAVEPCK